MNAVVHVTHHDLADTTDFSRVVPQLQPSLAGLESLDTTDFSRVEIQIRPSSTVQS